MTNKGSYMRKFIMLDNNTVGHLKNKSNKAKGYMKIEVRDGKGRLSLNVEGLEKPVDTDEVYKGYLLSMAEGKLNKVEIGAIIVNEKGKGSIEWNFNARSVRNTGIAIEDFNSVFVKLSSINNQDEDLIIPLTAYIHNNDGSLDSLIKELKIKPKEKQELPVNQNTTIQEPANSEISKEKIEESSHVDAFNNDIIDESEEFENIEDICDEVTEKEVTEKEETEIEQDDGLPDDIESDNYDDVEEDEQEKFDNYEFIDVEGKEDEYFLKGNNNNYQHRINYQDPGYSYKKNTNQYGHSVNKRYNYTEYAKNYSKQIAEYSMNILKFFQKVNPFNEELEGYTWWEIEYDNKNAYRGFLPFYNYIVNVYYPYPFMSRTTTCQSLMKKYNHYIFGAYEKDSEIKYYIYGIPGKFTREEQPYRGVTGFQTWLDAKDSGRERLGYWLIHIDALSGRIVNPLKPTPPRRFR